VGSRSTAAAMLIAALAGVGCARPEASDFAALDRAGAEESARVARDLEAALETVEARLYSGRATVRLWQELAERHKGVSALACVNAEDHVAAMEAADRKDRARLARHRQAKKNTRAAAEAHAGPYQANRSVAPTPATQRKAAP